MKKALISVVLVLLATSAFAQFRDTTWGMSLEQVIAIEVCDMNEGSQQMGLSFEAMRKYARQGRLPARKFGVKSWPTAADLDRWAKVEILW